MQKNNLLIQLILHMKLTHYLAELWACPVMPDYTHLKLLSIFVAFVDI